MKLLYSEAGKPLEYVDQKFSYDSEVQVTENVRNGMAESLHRLGANFQPSEFQVKSALIHIHERNRKAIRSKVILLAAPSSSRSPVVG